MDAKTVEKRLRLFLLVLAAGMCIGTIIELFLEEHMESATQLIPFVLCGLGSIAVLALLVAPSRNTVWGVRMTMGLVVLGSLFGLFEHIEHNIEFEMEIRPNATFGDVFFEALRGANPLLAPGILALIAMLAVAATYYHPVLGNRVDA